jgi:hypothetical protein
LKDWARDIMKQFQIVVMAFVIVSTVALSWGEGHESAAQAPVSGLWNCPANAGHLRAIPDFQLGKAPLFFIPNRGQIDERVLFYVQGKDTTVYFTAEGLTFVLSGRPQNWVVKLDFIGGRRGLLPVGAENAGAVVSYFKGRPQDWQTNLPTYSKIVYPGVWPGIDLICTGALNRLKYEFIVRPGADPSLIQLAYRGATALGIDKSGCLEVTTPAGKLRDDAPVAYQEAGGRKWIVSARYELGGMQNERRNPSPHRQITGPCGLPYGFRLAGYDRTKPLVIDPAVLVFCGYIGGSDDDLARGVAVDNAGYVYVAGDTRSSETTFPVNAGPDLSYNGTKDVFLAKVNSDGRSLVYCGYIGGSGDEAAYGLAVDADGNAYVGGCTNSDESTFPATIGPGLTYRGNYDGFVAKVSDSGTGLVFCGYIGGSADDFVHCITVDKNGLAYVAGQTKSDQTTFPVTVGPRLSHTLGNDAFVAKVSASGAGLVYCGYIGGSGEEDGAGVAVDSSGNAYVSGGTTSDESTFPVAVGPALTHGGGYDAYVAKVDALGTGFIYCGYVGGAGFENSCGIAVDSGDNAYIVGHTNSTEQTFPVVVGPDLTYNGGYDVYAAKINAAGTALIYCGYIGGANDDLCYNNNSIAVDDSGCAHVLGYTYSNETSFPVVKGPDLTFNGDADVFVAEVNASGAALKYCGYIGGAGQELGRGIAVDGAGNACVSGRTSSTEATFPVMTGPDRTFNGGLYDAFVAKISYWDEWAAKHAVGDFNGNGAREMAVDFGPMGVWLYQDMAWTQLTSANPLSLTAGDVDGDGRDEVVGAFGQLGLWLWDSGAWVQLSRLSPAGLAIGDVDADGTDEIVGAFGASGMWLYDGGVWTVLSGVEAEYVKTANLDGTGGDEIIGDFGAAGLWIWNAGVWTELSAVDADYVISGRAGGNRYLVGDFGVSGLWVWKLSGGWTELSGANADYMVAADTDGDGDDEVVGSFGGLGLWARDSGVWTQLSGAPAEFMIAADVNGDGKEEIAVDFGPIGLWLWNAGAWTQLSATNPEYLLAADPDGDNKEEIIADFGALGLWLWDEGNWSQISPLNPE